MRTEQQNKNLATLADYLLSLPDDYNRFDMATGRAGYSVNDVVIGEEIPEGSKAGPIGHAPCAGIGKGKATDWTQYTELCFTKDQDECNWLFMSQWVAIDNTHKGVAQRILALLETGWKDAYSEVIKFTNKQYIERPRGKGLRRKDLKYFPEGKVYNNLLKDL